MHPARSSVCLNCLMKWSPWQHMITRQASNAHKRQEKRKFKEENIVQYIDENTKRADRVYAWGCASTGAIG